ncbi:MAG: radical SAM protein [Desulfobaccales bacterium]
MDINCRETSPSACFTVLAKPTGRCNLRCVFCYQDANQMARGPRMTREVQESLVRRICEHNSLNIGLEWIGGEALTVGIDFYRRCEDLIARYQRPGTNITSPIQTNGTLLNQDWVDFLRLNRRYPLSIGFEIFRHLQNSLRKGFGVYADSYTIVSRNLRILKEAGIPFGVLTVIEPATLEIPAREWLQAVVEHGIRQVGLQFSYQQIYKGNLAKIQTYIDWIDQLFLEQAKHNEFCPPDQRLKIRESFYLYNMLRGTNVSYSCCHHSPAICSDFLISVGEDGRVYGHCDAFMGTSGEDGEPYLVGSITDQSFASILASSGLDRIRRSLARGREKCSPCAYFELCQGGCGFFKSMSSRSNGSIASGFGDPIESYCAIKIALLSYVTDPQRAEIIVRSYGHLNNRSTLPGIFIQTEGLNG